MLTSAGLSDVFRTIVSQEDVRVTKPDPEVYRLALTRLGIEPTEAVALEDSPTGLAAARAAGVRALAIGHRRLRGDWVGEATYVSDLRDIDTVLSLLGFGSQA